MKTIKKKRLAYSTVLCFLYVLLQMKQSLKRFIDACMKYLNIQDLFFHVNKKLLRKREFARHVFSLGM